jgi:hypothetical protein
MKFVLKPTTFRILLIFSLLVIAAAGAGSFVFGHQEIVKYAEETRKLNTEAQASSNELQALSSLKSKLDNSKSDVKRAEQIVSTSKKYHYQDQIVSDIENHANSAGIKIASIDFSANESKSSSSSSSSSSSTAKNTKKPAPDGFKSVTATVNLSNPVSYEQAYIFLRSLEQGLFRMQISNLALAKDDNNGITVSALTLEVYTK